MSPLAAASASGESCTGGGPSRGHSPPTSQASRSQLPRLGGGGFFRLSVLRVQLFTWSCSYPATLSRCQEAAPARLSRRQGQTRRCPLQLSGCSQRRLCTAAEAAERGGQKGLHRSEVGSLGISSNQREYRIQFPAPTCKWWRWGKARQQ